MNKFIEDLIPLFNDLTEKIKTNVKFKPVFEKYANDYNYYVSENNLTPSILSQSAVYYLLSLSIKSNESLNRKIEKLENHNCLDLLLRELYKYELLTDLINYLDKVNFRIILQEEIQNSTFDTFIFEILNALIPKEMNVRKSLGYFFTPESIVSFIFDSAEHFVKSDLKFQNGFLEQKKERTLLKILDPALGIGTYLLTVINNAEKEIKALGKDWNDHVSKNLLPMINGFEISLPSLSFAYLRIVSLLFKTDYKFEGSEKINLFLANSLNEKSIINMEDSLFLLDMKETELIKNESKINIILSTPPFGASPSIRETYKAPKNSVRPLFNDNFLHLSQLYIQQTGHGVIGLLIPNGYIYSSAFAKMREELLVSFSKIYILNLHGNRGTEEKSPTGVKDENIIGINVGISILFLIKTKEVNNKSLASVFYSDLWGTSQYKHKYLLEHDFDSIKWQELKPFEPSYEFNSLSIPLDIDLKDNCLHSLQKGISSFQEFQKSYDYWLLKESILFLNNGIELLMKHILAKQNEHLIFDDKKLTELQKKANKYGIDVFDLSDPPRTVNYYESIQRVEAFINKKDFNKAFTDNLLKLNKLRNKIEHHKALLDGQIVNELINEIREPLQEILKNHDIEASFLDFEIE